MVINRIRAATHPHRIFLGVFSLGFYHAYSSNNNDDDNNNIYNNNDNDDDDDGDRMSIRFLEWLVLPSPVSKASASPSREQNYVSLYDLYHIKG